MKIVATNNIRIDSANYTRDQHLATIETDIPFGTLANMIQMGQAQIIGAQIIGARIIDAGVQPLVARPEETETETETELTTASALGSFGIPDRIVDLLAASSPPILTKSDVVDYLATHRDLTPVHGIGRATSDQIKQSLGIV